ncbi:PREDICTED: DNA repair protein complementing XP-G cells [Ceratosolen solmsi marchali]|uniref:DNA repair protein complementing XP-G cells n=1 Tax=Ceratosolen solmsi marchali TaxID=326594 RepID=A0AAJ6YY88_9HYME|nr:PREDICTED: DNA repair protein complementing XP-G cells [Ceratosolen solmsi marchali]
MGVIGLWRLIDATGKPVPLEKLEGKVLAIDVSIWIHQVIQGYQDRQGNSIPNAHLIGLFNRICKLMYFKIKPVFVFDGGVPLLKKKTTALRRKLKSIATCKAQKLKNDLISNLMKYAVVKGTLDKGNEDSENNAKPRFTDSTVIADSSKFDDMYKLPDIVNDGKSVNSDDYQDSDEESELELSPRKQARWIGNIHNVNVNTEEFKNLPADVRYDILTDLKETRKQNSWGRIHELPAGSNNYSGFQVKRLLKRRYVQESLEFAEKEMGGKTLTLEELDKLLTDQGIQTTQNDEMFRIASDSKTRVIYMKDKPPIQNNENSNDLSNLNLNELSEQDSHSNDKCIDSVSIKSDSSVAVIDNMNAYDFDEDWYSDESFAETTLNDSKLLTKNAIPKTIINPALSYMLENSGLTRDQIMTIVEQSKKNKKRSDDNSSQGSSKRGKKWNSRYLRNKCKRKILFDSSKRKAEIPNSLESATESDVLDVEDSQKFNSESQEIKSIDSNKIITMESSDSESNDFIEISEQFNTKTQQIRTHDSNKTIIMESSDSESNDFIEIQDVPIPESMDSTKLKSNSIQITIKADEELQDDMFADVFSDIHNKADVFSDIDNKADVFNDIDIKADIVDKSKLKLVDNQEKDIFKDNVFAKITEGENSIPDEELNITESVILKKASPDVAVMETNIKIKDDDIHKDSIVEKSETSLITDSSERLKDEELQKEHNYETIAVPKVSTSIFPLEEKELESMKKRLELDQQQISESLGKLERQATDVNDQMKIEAQELLQLFGIPYIVAPMEAEAQCAYLEQIKLTDGTITDDSDIWLFGGECVYKNFFDNNKKVLQFLSSDINHHFKLSRNELILLALLVGSDYTSGLSGVGPVTALEILAAFPSDEKDILRGLRAFSSWYRAGKLSAPGKATLRNKLKNVHIERGFPNQAIVQAYVCPLVDESKESFTWGKPNLILLADYAKKKFGWTKLKFEEIITPVMKKVAENKSQRGIESYFKVQSVPKSIETTLSKRIQLAVQQLGNKSQNIHTTDEIEKVKRTTKSSVGKGRKFKEGTKELLPIAEINEDEKTVEISQEVDEQPSQGNNKIQLKKLMNASTDIIPQKEQDKANALKSKLRAIEIFRKSKKGLNRIKKVKKFVKQIKDEAELSESSSSS